MKKQAKIWIAVAAVFLIAGISIYFVIQEQQKQAIMDSLKIEFYEDKTIEYGSSFDAEDLIKEKTGTLGELPIIDTMKVGEQTLVFTIQKDGYEKEIKHSIVIEDSKAPVIKLKEKSITIQTGTAFDAKDNIESVRDPVDGKLEYQDEKEADKGTYIIISDVDSKQAGEYTVTIRAMDKNGNEAEKSYSVLIQNAVTAENTNNAGKSQSNTAGGNQKNNNADSSIQPTYVNGILLVNKNHPLPRNFGGTDATAYAALQRLQNGAAQAGYSMPLISGYRSYDYQAQLYNGYVARDGQAAADRYSARPGKSEHQTGLAFDVGSIDNNFGQTPAGQWLYQHCAEYGFIIRYMQGKESVTGYMYEPWHIRYVGVEVAQDIMARGITLEEYLGVY